MQLTGLAIANQSQALSCTAGDFLCYIGRRLGWDDTAAAGFDRRSPGNRGMPGGAGRRPECKR